ncbi:MAG: hypothetical protein HQ471_08655 [Flavobacteriales bacterium]|jgi:hypothetical protein|nr:hypothetical protein [Flavobacteriales bacterium]
MKKLTLIYGLLIFTPSCVFTRIDDSIDLGKKYRYIQDYPQTIIYHKTEKYNGIGLNAVPPTVLNYDFNDKFIIAKNVDLEKEEMNYWIIDKDKDNSDIKPLDSLTFHRTLIEKKIGLRLK